MNKKMTNAVQQKQENQRELFEHVETQKEEIKELKQKLKVIHMKNIELENV